MKNLTKKTMSNNKQTIKLYTQEQVKLMIDDAHNGVDGYYDILKNHNPIEFPSDEEISEVAMIVYGFNARDIKDVLEYKAFKRGAKYVINKIQGGNQ